MPKLCVKYICYMCTIVTLLSDKEIILLGIQPSPKNLAILLTLCESLVLEIQTQEILQANLILMKVLVRIAKNPIKLECIQFGQLFFVILFVCFFHFRGRMLLLLFSEGEVSPFKVCLLHRANSVS